MSTLRKYGLSILVTCGVLAFSPSYADYVGSILGNKEDVKRGLLTKDEKPVKEAGYSP